MMLVERIEDFGGTAIGRGAGLNGRQLPG